MQWLREMWTKEGPGIPKNAPRKTGLALFGQTLARECWELVKLNLLFILTAVFIVTIPAAIAATARICVAHVEDRNTYLLRDFVEAFTRYFWRATAWSLLFAGAIGLSGYAIATYAHAAPDNVWLAFPLTVALVVTVFLGILACHLLVLMVMRDLPALTLLKLAAVASFMRPLPVMAAMLFVVALWLAHILLYPVSVIMPAAFNFSLGMFAIVFSAHRAAVTVLALPPARQSDLKPEAGQARHI